MLIFRRNAACLLLSAAIVTAGFSVVVAGPAWHTPMGSTAQPAWHTPMEV